MVGHHGHDPQSVTVAELVERQAKAGHPLRLNWRDADTGAGRREEDVWPTGVLPRIVDGMVRQAGGVNVEATAGSAVGLPKRRRDAVLPEPGEPVWVQHDPELLGRVLERLRRWV